jgi:hypothetical protein
MSLRILLYEDTLPMFHSVRTGGLWRGNGRQLKIYRLDNQFA